MTLHIVVDISHHGFGHLAQTAPVLQALGHRQANLRLTVRSTLPKAVLHRRIGEELHVIPSAQDVGMCMASALEVLPEDSARAHGLLHREWTNTVSRSARELEALTPDLVIANIPYLTLAAGALAGIPTVAMCSLNWADIYGHYCGAIPGGTAIHRQMLKSYEEAGLFLQPRPHMPMTYLPQRKSVGPVAQLGTRRRGEMARKLGIEPHERLVLVGLGGIATRLSVERWPTLPGTRWLVPGDWLTGRSDCLPLESLAMPFIDILASSDVMIAKPGYGAFVEAACHGLPVLYLARPDWPEEPYLSVWLHQHARALEVQRRDFRTGRFVDALEGLLEQPAPTPILPSGVDEAADILAGRLTA